MMAWAWIIVTIISDESATLDDKHCHALIPINPPSTWTSPFPNPTHLGVIKFCCLEQRLTIVFIDFGLTILLSRLMCQDGPYSYCSHFMAAFLVGVPESGSGR